MEKLEICRDLIDSIDNQIIELYVKRMEIVKEITKLKRENDLPVLDQNREKRKKRQRKYELRTRHCRWEPGRKT